ncbi:MAG: hypothetical protein K2O70_11020 [Desulfovibrionaceae bacterium]|nr:hypothetical protein [Desulfovibrionaceae bacterium]
MNELTRCTFIFEHHPEDYQNTKRITRIWQSLGDVLPGVQALLHLTPWCDDGPSSHSRYFLRAGYTASGGCARLVSRSELRMYAQWELEEPFPAPALMLSFLPAPDKPDKLEAVAQRLVMSTGEDVKWRMVQASSDNFFDPGGGFSVVMPVDTEAIITPEKAVLAWRWLDAFLEQAQNRRWEGHPSCLETLPETHRVARTMCYSPSLICFSAPESGFVCPHCGDSPDEEFVMEALGKAYEDNPEAPDLDMTVPCCGAVLPFNALENTWMGFGRFSLQFYGVQCEQEDFKELNNLLDIPFKLVHVCT